MSCGGGIGALNSHFTHDAGPYEEERKPKPPPPARRGNAAPRKIAYGLEKKPKSLSGVGRKVSRLSILSGGEEELAARRQKWEEEVQRQREEAAEKRRAEAEEAERKRLEEEAEERARVEEERRRIEEAEAAREAERRRLEEEAKAEERRLVELAERLRAEAAAEAREMRRAKREAEEAEAEERARARALRRALAREAKQAALAAARAEFERKKAEAEERRLAREVRKKEDQEATDKLRGVLMDSQGLALGVRPPTHGPNGYTPLSPDSRRHGRVEVSGRVWEITHSAGGGGAEEQGSEIRHPALSAALSAALVDPQRRDAMGRAVFTEAEWEAFKVGAATDLSLLFALCLAL